MSYADLKARLDAGATIILDGGTGTELEKRGVTMSEAAWCGLASLDHQDVLIAVHRDYIEAGADVITANTFASSRLMLSLAGAGDRVGEVAQVSLEAAFRARDRSGREAVVAGSISHMTPLQPGTDKVHDEGPETRAMRDAFHELAEALATAGAELILLEMMYHPDRMPHAIDAALATGLPVWCGMSARMNTDGQVLSFSRQAEIPFERVVELLPDHGLDAVGIMHSSAHDTGPALAMLSDREALMAYPDCGHFTMPHWQFDDLYRPEALVHHAREWRSQGARILGGCCGIGVSHIRALADMGD